MKDELRKQIDDKKKGNQGDVDGTSQERVVKRSSGTAPVSEMARGSVARNGRTVTDFEDMEMKGLKTGQKKKGVKSGLIVFILILLVGGFIAYMILTGRTYTSASGTVGNSAGNLYNGGLFCENAGRIYFSNPNDDYTLYSMSLDLKDFKKLYNDYARYINADENYVYYTRMNNKKDSGSQSIFVFYSTGVYRVRKNGSGLKMMSSDPCGSLLLYDNKLFYQSYKDNVVSLHKIGIDGKDDVKLFSDDTSVVSVLDDRLYYSGKLSDQNIHYMNMEGKVSVAIEAKAYMPMATEDGIYYISTDNKYNLFLADFEDKERKRIVNHLVSWYNVTPDGRYVFYNCDEGDDSAVYMLDMETKEETVISEGNYKWLNIAGNYCFFFDFFNERPYAYDYVNKRLVDFDPPAKKK